MSECDYYITKILLLGKKNKQKSEKKMDLDDIFDDFFKVLEEVREKLKQLKVEKEKRIKQMEADIVKLSGIVGTNIKTIENLVIMYNNLEKKIEEL